jgi:leucine dehydrogenase
MWASEQLVLCSDDEVGLRAVIAIDDTTLGPGLGGVRLRSYPSDEAAVAECRRLAAAMTRKNAVAELPFGGAKSVILAPSDGFDRVALMRRFGAFVARTNGAYLPGVDMGTTPADLALMAAVGAEVSCDDEDPSPWTALGVAAAVHAAVAHVDGRAELDRIRVLVQGAGHVGEPLARLLAANGAHVLIADVDRERAHALAAELGGDAVAPEAALATPCDVFAPCAVARVVSARTAGRLACRIVAGAANDTLADDRCARLLAARGIAYVPDYVANAGGVLHIHARREGWDDARLRAAVLEIGERVRDVLEEARAAGTTPLDAAEARAARRLAAARGQTRDGAAATRSATRLPGAVRATARTRPATGAAA